MRHFPRIVLVLCLQLGSVGSAQDLDVADLHGTWDEVTPSRQRVGYQVAPAQLSLTFVGSVCTWDVRGGGIARQSLFIPVRAGSQRAMDFVTVDGGALLKTRALFKVEGNSLTIKEAALDGPRPSDLAPWTFDGQNSDTMATVGVYRRRVTPTSGTHRVGK